MPAASLNVLTIFSALDKVTPITDKISKSGASMQKKLNNVGNSMLAAGTAGVTALGLSLNEAIKFEDKMTDVRKVFQGSEKDFLKLQKGILDISETTRTTIPDLQDMAYEAGRMGIMGDDILPFLKVMNKFNVALGEDFPGGAKQATQEVSKLTTLFKDVYQLKPDVALNKVGSAINEIAQTTKGVTAENITDFAKRFSGLPDVIAPVSSSILALGGTLESLGIDWEAGAGGAARFMSLAAGQLEAFSKQMGLTKQQGLELLQQDSAQFLVKFSQSLRGLNAEQFQKKMKELGINLLLTKNVIGKLSSERGLEVFNKTLATSVEQIDKANSITKEYDLVNDSAAGKLKQFKNQISRLSIEAGGALVPALKEVMNEIKPIITSLAQWIGQNPEFIGRLAEISVLIVAFAIGLKAVATAMSIATGVQAAYTAVVAAYSAVAVTAALTGSSFAAVIWATLAPILAVIAAIAAIIAIIYYWDEICAWFSEQWKRFTGWISEKWDNLVKLFKNFSFKNFFKQIGNSIIEFLLFPLKSVLAIVSSFPGKIGEIAKQQLSLVDKIGFTIEEEPNKKKELLPNANTESNKQTQEVIHKLSERPSLKDLIDINVNDKGGNVSSVKSNNVPVKLNSTKSQTR